MKKILCILGMITLIGTSTTSLVACNTPPQEYTKEQLDKLKKENQIDTTNETIKNNLEWIAPQEKPFNQVDDKWYFVIWRGNEKNDWRIVKFKFNNSQITNIDKYDKYITLADNIVGILFQKEIAGFLAGLVTTIWLNLHQTEFQQQLNIATYGGMDNPVGVSNYLWGFLLSADVFNEIIKTDVRYPNLHQLMTDILAIIKNINPKINNLLPIRKVQEVLNDNESWFSQSFNQGEGKVISDYLINKKASIIFPVAGPQTQDTIDRIKYNKMKTKVVGVDTAQSQIYGDEYIITSGLLNIAQSTEDALSNIYSTTCSYNNVTKQWDNKQLDSCWINTDQSSKTNSNWLGIEKTKWIDDSIINYINNDAKITKLTTTIGMIYDQIKQEHFTDTLKLTYQTQNEVKTKLLETLEKGLG